MLARLRFHLAAMIGPGSCRDCPHRQFCANHGECLPMAVVAGDNRPKAKDNTPKPVKPCRTCAGTRRVDILPLFEGDPDQMPCPECRPAPKASRSPSRRGR